MAVGLAAQELNLDWFLTVAEQLDYHAGYFGMPRSERRERADELLEAFSLTDKRDERTRTLSGGMKRRLVLARALMHRPRLLILDEPTAGVDVELRLELWQYVKRINSEGTTILLTTHYLEEAEQLCDHIAFINDGLIVASGTSAELSARFGVASLEDAYLELVGAASSRAPASARPRLDRGTDPLRRARAPRGQPLHEDQAPDGGRAPARDLPLHLGVRRRAGLAHRHPRRGRLRGLHHPRPRDDGLGDQRLLQQLVLDPAAEVPARDRRPALLPASPLELLLAFSLGGFLRGMLVAVLTFTAASILVDVPVKNVHVLIRASCWWASSSPSSAC